MPISSVKRNKDWRLEDALWYMHNFYIYPPPLSTESTKERRKATEIKPTDRTVHLKILQGAEKLPTM